MQRVFMLILVYTRPSLLDPIDIHHCLHFTRLVFLLSETGIWERGRINRHDYRFFSDFYFCRDVSAIFFDRPLVSPPQIIAVILGKFRTGQIMTYF